MCVCVCSRQQERQAASSSLQEEEKKPERKAKKEGKREVGEGLKQDRIEGWGAGDGGEGEIRDERAPKVEKMTKKLRRGDKKKRGRERMIKERSCNREY